ncbi:hypothetical protein ABW19_dt0200657 [Dactylella cylindrospora]|nr:hypothetical protein ABW19_dt0200657 [Dactylella cylindrospora]
MLGDKASVNAALVVAVVVLGISTFGCLILALYLYIKFKRMNSNTNNGAELQHELKTRNLSRLVERRRNSVILKMMAYDINPPRSFSLTSLESVALEEGNSQSNLSPTETRNQRNNPYGESWAIRKVRSMERLTELTSELVPAKEKADPFPPEALKKPEENPFQELGLVASAYSNPTEGSINPVGRDQNSVDTTKEKWELKAFNGIPNNFSAKGICRKPQLLPIKTNCNLSTGFLTVPNFDSNSRQFSPPTTKEIFSKRVRNSYKHLEPLRKSHSGSRRPSLAFIRAGPSILKPRKTETSVYQLK